MSSGRGHGKPASLPPASGEPTVAAVGPMLRRRPRVNGNFATHWMGACHEFPRCVWCEQERQMIDDWNAAVHDG